jgi:hypothetical protein
VHSPQVLGLRKARRLGARLNLQCRKSLNDLIKRAR